MFNEDYTHITFAERLGDEWFNPDESRFAVLPREDGTFDNEMIRLLEQMIDEHIGHDTGGRPEEMLSELFDLHARRIVLWPLGLLWGRSAIDTFDEKWFSFMTSEADPDLAEIRTAIRGSAPLVHLKPRQQQNFSFALWKVLTAIHYSSDRVATLDDIQEAHFVALGRMMRPDGVWADWATVWIRKTLKFSIRYLAEVRGEPHFGRGVDATLFSHRGRRRIDLFAAAPHLKWLERSYDTWVNERALMSRKNYEPIKRLLAEAFLKCENHQVDSPEKAFSRPNVLHLLRFAGSWSTAAMRSNAIGRIHDFCRWLEDQSRDSQGSPRIVCGLSQADVERFRKKMLRDTTRSGGSEVVARPMPYRYHLELKKIISEENFAWPRSLVSAIDGRPLHWFTWTDPTTGAANAVFNEVQPRLLMLLLDLPLRSIQARRLDSGEGDARRWNPDTDLWEASESEHAGHWHRTGAKNPDRGVFREIPTHGSNGPSTITGFYINSNKTQDRRNLFDETSGYVIPWKLDEALQNLSAMREWQEKYNPVDGPLAYLDIPKGIFNDTPTRTAEVLIPDRFYLFRDPRNPGPRGREAPATYKILVQFFYDALEELERRQNEEDPDNPITIITERDESGAPKKAIFTLHGTRASTITSLYAEGVPIAVLSKLVAGHATILMTLKYAKFEPAHVSEILSRARVAAIHNSASEFKIFLANATYEQAARMSAWLKEDGVAQLKGAYAGNSSTWLEMDIGICPNGGTLCHIGGDPVVKKRDLQGKRDLHKETPGGDRNCLRCRFLVSGLPYLIPLCGRANMISACADQFQSRIAETESEVERLKAERRDLNARGEPTPQGLRQQILLLEAEWERDTQLRHQAFADFHAALTLVEKIRIVARDTSDGATVPMVVNEDGLPEVGGRESTRFELCDAIVQMGRFFPSLRSAELERERDEFLDRILYSGGYTPITLAPLSREEKRAAADAMSAMLLARLGAIESEALIDGRKTLQDLGLQDRLETVVEDTIGRPLDRLTFIAQRGVDPVRIIEH